MKVVDEIGSDVSWMKIVDEIGRDVSGINIVVGGTSFGKHSFS